MFYLYALRRHIGAQAFSFPYRGDPDDGPYVVAVFRAGMEVHLHILDLIRCESLQVVRIPHFPVVDIDPGSSAPDDGHAFRSPADEG